MANLNSQKKYHYIYKTTNIKNGKYYIGMHSTNKLNDDYLGSGKRLRYSINKNGKQNFKIEFLEFFDNRVDYIVAAQNRYCENQQKNERTFNVLKAKLGEERAKYFMETILFPKID